MPKSRLFRQKREITPRDNLCAALCKIQFFLFLWWFWWFRKILVCFMLILLYITRLKFDINKHFKTSKSQEVIKQNQEFLIPDNRKVEELSGSNNEQTENVT